MAADVSTLVRLLSGGGGEEGSPKSDLVTRDLLGGCCVVVGGGGAAPSPAPKKAPFPDLHVLSAEEKGLQAMDLNLPPLWPSAPLRPGQMAALETSAPAQDLRLRSLAPPPPPAVGYQSVCTLEKVKSALERAERETWGRQQKQDPPAQPRRAPARSASPTSSSTTTSSAKRRLGGGAEEGEEESGSSPGTETGVAKGDGGAAHPTAEMAAAGCPSCLMYVLISRWNPRCPRCRSAVPLPPPPPHAGKKPRIDLNAATTSAAAVSSSPITTLKFF